VRVPISKPAGPFEDEEEDASGRLRERRSRGGMMVVGTGELLTLTGEP
jgi:hypothetical protein